MRKKTGVNRVILLNGITNIYILNPVTKSYSILAIGNLSIMIWKTIAYLHWRNITDSKIEAFVQHEVVRINMRTNQFLRITQNTHFLLSEAHYPSLEQNREFWSEYSGMSKF